MRIDLPSLGATKLASAPRVGRVHNEPFIEKETVIEVRARDPQEARRLIEALANKKHGKHGGL